MNEVATKEDLKNLSQDILRDISKLILENNVVLVNMMDEKIAKNNDVLIPMMEKMMDRKIKENNEIILTTMSSIIDEKIGKNNELIFEHFNDQTDRILGLFKGVMRVNVDGNLGIYV